MSARTCLCRALVGALVICAAAGSAHVRALAPTAADTNPALVEATAQATAHGSADIPARADADQQHIQDIVHRAQVPDVAQRYDAALARHSTAIGQLAERSGKSDLAVLSVRRLESLQRHWLLYERVLTQTRAELARSTNAKSEDMAELAKRRAVWQATGQTAGLAPALLERVDELIAMIDDAEKQVAVPLTKLLDLGRKGSALATQVQQGIDSVSGKVDDQDRRLVSIDTPPLWQALGDTEALDPVSIGLSRSLEIERAFASGYDAANVRWLPALAAGALLLLPAMVWLRYRARLLVAAGQATEPSMRALSRPWAAWLLLVLIGAVFYDIQGPIFRQQAVMLLAWIPVLALVQRRVLARVGPWAYFSAVFYFLNTLASMLLGDQLLYRGVLLTLNLLMLLTLAWRMLRARRVATEDSEQADTTHVKALTFLGWVACVVLLVSAGSNVLGNVSLATMLTGALLDSSYAALALYAGSTVLVALFQVLIPRTTLARIAGRHSGSLIPLAARLARTLMVLAWLVYTLQSFRVYRPLSALLMTVLTHQFQLGQISISLGNIAAFAAAVWVAFWLARTIRLLLAEDLLPALSLPRGVGDSISTLTYYSIVFLGLLAALAMAGFQVGQLAIIFGALGVGIGLGLQDVVKNFVAGLILMFERPIRLGDVVDVAGMSGTVRDIGMRATIITSFDGAEVVVPNGMLLADKLVNWTLHGSSRRISIEISTGYGVSPQQTIELLVGIARRIEGIALSPAPNAIMTGLTPGALEFSLRAWTTQQADWVEVRSELARRIRDGLAEAGIEVPLPQREMHVRSVPGVAVVAAVPDSEVPVKGGGYGPKSPNV
ncbi:mechanosensitive ion channel family protein [Propionivibrio sp.]|uniref:mechanosensitive ion channel family protein n=1 Tax=Propionivibrio sp. TaxID=2212460 RepID=UPI003BF3009E